VNSPRLAHELAAGDERLHQEVAEVGALVQHLAQPVGRHRVDFRVAAGDGADDRRVAGQVGHVAGERPGPVDRERLRRVAGLVQDLDRAGLDDVEVEVAVAGLEEPLPVSKALGGRAGAAPQRGELGLVERGEGDGAQVRLGHVRASSGDDGPGSAEVRQGLPRQVHLRLIDVAPGPALARLEGRHYWVVYVVEMLSSVAVRRTVTTADVTATQAETQMDPGRACFQALFTPLRRSGGDRVEVGFVFANHDGPPGKEQRSSLHRPGAPARGSLPPLAGARGWLEAALSAGS
jgi:hypothetical protein